MASQHADYLREHLQEIDRRLERFLFVRPEDVPHLRAYLQETLNASPARIAAAIQSSRERSHAIERGIRQAVGAAPLWERGIAGTVQRRIAYRSPKAYGLQSVPCLPVIRRVLEVMRTEQREITGNHVTTLHLQVVPQAYACRSST